MIGRELSSTVLSSSDLQAFVSAVHTLANCSVYPTCDVKDSGYLLTHPASSVAVTDARSFLSLMVVSNQLRVIDTSPSPPPAASLPSVGGRRGLRAVEIEDADSKAKMERVRAYFTTTPPVEITSDLRAGTHARA